MDVTERKRAEEERQALAHANRVTTMGHLTASIAHEVNQPLAAVVTNAQAALRWLNMQPPDPEEVRQALDRIVQAGRRASDVISRMRALVRKAPPRKDQLDVNEVMLEVIALTRSELRSSGTLLQTELAGGLPLVLGDRIQLQQVMLNLILNAIEAMSGLEGVPRVADQHGRRRSERRAHRRAGLGSGTEAGEYGPALRRILHDQAGWYGHGTVDLPFDH
jgi:C4-dicarboxylate-specific signal transduction histidine kinase